MTTTVEPSAGTTAIRPFTVQIPEADLDELRARIAAVRLAQQGARRRSVAGRAAGDDPGARPLLGDRVRLAHGARRELNALPQFKTEIDGLDIHFIHVKSPHENALPLIMTHGWPGSVIELLDTVGPLTDPTAHGGRAEDAFHLVLPSIPGYGFSDEPTEVGWDPVRVARAWAELMRRLGYTRYVAQGGDVGSHVTDAMGRLALDGLLGIHINLLTAALADAEPAAGATPRRNVRRSTSSPRSRTTGNGYFVEQATRPETIGYCPAGFTRRPGGLDDRSRHGQLREDRPRLRRRASPRAISPGNRSSTTSRCTG